MIGTYIDLQYATQVVLLQKLLLPTARAWLRTLPAPPPPQPPSQALPRLLLLPLQATCCL